jgi:UDP-glucose 4-epimerase
MFLYIYEGIRGESIMSILVTGGAGYIGSHTCVELLNAGYNVVVVDNLSNSSKESLKRVEQITGKPIVFYESDLLDQNAVTDIFRKESIEAVIHFAGLKAVGESVEKPLEYYYNNITGTLILCKVMREYGVKNIIFSSSATVYGKPDTVPITEDFPLSVTNPYGRTKLMIEDILRDLSIADKEWNIILLRYFNPIGAHKSGLIGEDPSGTPNNLVPYITQVAIGKLDVVQVFGNDYDTPDGSGVRDYIHVVDLASGHVKAIEKLRNTSGVHTYNLGTGTGYSVFDIISTFSRVCNRDISYVIKPRRPGDIAICYSECSLAEKELGWTAQRNLYEMCEDAWRWQKNNPNGYRS